MEPAFRLASRLGIRWPILQAPAGGPVGAALAVAVSEAGAVGAFPLTWTAPGTAEALIAEVRYLVAAGGIGDGREVARALSLGASGAMLVLALSRLKNRWRTRSTSGGFWRPRLARRC